MRPMIVIFECGLNPAGMTYRSGCAGEFKERCRTQPISMGVKFVDSDRIEWHCPLFAIHTHTLCFLQCDR